MTNGEKIKEIFPYMTKQMLAEMLNIFEWWSAEYKEPTKHEVKYCDRNICLKNEYNNVGCEDCEVTKSQEPTIKNDLGVDCIDRAKAQTEIEMNAFRYTLAKERGGTGKVEWDSHLIAIDDVVDIIRNLPSITPQEPRKGHWVADVDKWGDVVTTVNGYKCDKCNAFNSDKDNFCPNCGADMRGEE